jgi:exopolyphosphatase/guanosine-5'-triphosphate,3'-diphosphate pyrophosphatase
VREKFAAVDIGSNSCLLLIVEKISAEEATVLLDTRRSTRVSADVAKGGAIGDQASATLFQALEEFQSLIHENQVGGIAAVATQVFRTAKNGELIAEQIRDRFGWPLEIVSGEMEARLSYLAATSGLEEISDRRIVADVGGGSTEVISGSGTDADFLHSYSIGAATLTEKFGLHELVSNDLVRNVDGYLSSLFLGDDVRLPHSEGDLVLVGGTIATLAAAFQQHSEFDPARVHGATLQADWIEQTSKQLSESTVEQRRAFIPFDPDRAEIILAGTLIVRWLLNWSTRKSLIVSNRGLRWGLLQNKFDALKGLEIKHTGS